MNAKILFGLGLAMFVIVAEVSGRSCSACGFGEGVDYCKNCAPAYIQPAAFHQPRPNKPFRAVGDVCDCRDVNVHPVALPKPKYVHKAKPKCERCDNRPLIRAPDHMHDFTHEEEYPADNSYYTVVNGACGQQPLYPVDAVSIDLVNRMQKSAAMTIPEEKLQYGFSKLPQEMPTYKKTSNVPEEKMFTVDRQIVELKNPQQVVKCGTGCDEEVVLESKEPAPIPYLSYRDLGFVPETNNRGTFVSSCRGHHNKPRYSSHESEHYYKGGDSSEEYDYRTKHYNSGCGCNKKVKSSCGCGY